MIETQQLLPEYNKNYQSFEIKGACSQLTYVIFTKKFFSVHFWCFFSCQREFVTYLISSFAYKLKCLTHPLTTYPPSPPPPQQNTFRKHFLKFSPKLVLPFLAIHQCFSGLVLLFLSLVDVFPTGFDGYVEKYAFRSLFGVCSCFVLVSVLYGVDLRATWFSFGLISTFFSL